MGQSFKAILQLALIASVIAAVSLWAEPDSPGKVAWTFRCALPMLAIVVAVVLFRNAKRRETLPDHLYGISSRYFERDGFCFCFVPLAVSGISSMQVYFQNRYSRPCRARVVLLGPRKHVLELQRLPVGVDVDIECDGAAFGVSRIPWPIPTDIQGTQLRFEVGCNTLYPAGGGKLVRFREGLRCGATSRDLARAALAALGTISSPAHVTLTLPVNVNAAPSVDATAKTEILFRPDFATGGFPISPAVGVIRKDA